MNSAMMVDLLKSLSLLGGFLIIGMFLRAKFKIFQVTFIPASVIGGVLLLLLGPQVFNLLPVSGDWFTLYSLLPGVLIVPIVATVPLGLHINIKSENNESKILNNIIPLTCIGVAISMLQFAIGFGTQIIFGKENLYDVFGIELGVGFVGGHGTAGTLGSTLSEMGVVYWDVSQGVGTTTATFGIVGGILIGIALINWAARSGNTAMLTKPADIPEHMRVGFEPNIEKQSSIGRETTFSSSIDTVAFHVALIFMACGLAYWVQGVMKDLNIPILSSISVWAYGIIVMFAIWGIICKMKVDFLVDSRVRSKISGSFTEFAVIAAVASLPIKTVATYILPILVMVTLGFIVTVLVLFIYCKKFLKGYWFEQMIATFGMCTGVFLTGVLLLRICDPKMESPALANYTLSYTVCSIIFFALLDTFINLPITSGTTFAISATLIIAATAIIIGIVYSQVMFRNNTSSNK
ncbi:MAG: glutamate:sodium symporter [Candidatus Epulonipiscium fishelsonii]|nr:MAG: glutamate:sodium symporter [Epulopiscium sp. AS2M-Bin002]